MNKKREKNTLILNLTFIFLVCYAIISSFCYSQSQNRMTGLGVPLDETLKVFIDCNDCDFSYIRNQIKFVNFVRDPHVAHIHVLIVKQKTASGGYKYTIRFIGQFRFENIEQSLYYISAQTDSKDDIRQGLTRVLEFGLLPFVSQTPIAGKIDVKYDEQKVDSLRKLDTDKWMYWVFNIEATGEAEAEEKQNEFNLVTGLSAERITEVWKIEAEFQYEYDQENFIDDNEKITSQRSEWETDAKVIKSLTDHWSSGVFGSGNSSTRKNIDLSLGLFMGMEYNFFPWEQSDRRIFSLSYLFGVRTFDYIERTLFEKTSERLISGRARLEFRMIQGWGEIDASLENNHYYQDFSKNRLKLETALSFWIIEGLAFKLGLEAESIHDQLYLPKGEATREEILLKQKQLETNFDISIRAGLRYSFGSIYNNVVNRRF